MLDRAKRKVEARLQEYYAGFMRADFLKLPVMAAYERYYCRRDKLLAGQTEPFILSTGRAPLETFTEIKPLVENPDYQAQRQKCLAGLHDGMIDTPIIEVINAFNQLPFCFTLQCCYGHFVYEGQDDPHNLEPLPQTDTIARMEYRIAYIALCIENSDLGRLLLDALKGIADIDPENIQLGCAEWFWERQLNSYALQVEPDRFKFEDKAILDYQEALKIEKIRNEFFVQLKELLQKPQWREKPD